MMSERRFKRKLAKIQKRGERYKRERELLDKYAEYVPERKKRRVSNFVLVIVIIAVVAYAVADYVLQKTTGVEISPTLTTCWYAFFGTELFALAGIKVSKIIRNSNNDVCG